MISLSLAVAFCWFIAANVAALTPSRDNHWSRAYVLIATGIPLLGWVTWENGPIIGLLVLFGAMSVLRWPVYSLWKRIRG